MLTIQQANQYLQGSPFSDLGLQSALKGDSESSEKLRKIVLELYTGISQCLSLQSQLEGFDEEYKGYVLSILANYLIYRENDILFINTAQELEDAQLIP